MENKKILFVLHTMPWPLNLGGNQAMYNGIVALRGLADIFVTFPLALKTPDYDIFLANIGPDIKVFPYFVKSNFSLKKYAVIIAKILLRPFYKKKFNSSKYLDDVLSFPQVAQDEISFINSIIVENKIDIVQIEMLSHISLVNSLPINIRKVFVHHEIGYVVKEQLVDKYGGNDYFKSKLATYKILEIGLLNLFDDIIVLSEVDKHKLQNEGVVVPIHASFAIVKSPQSITPRIEDYHSLFFIGTSKHRPNYLGLLWFLENCWNNLLNIDSNYKLNVISFWDKELIKSITIKYKNINFLGYVENIDKVLIDGIMIVPITVGSGIRMKILEAANHGMPVVSTTIGAEGLPLVDSENSYITDNPKEFVDDILKLKDVEIRRKFVFSLYENVKKNYSLEALRDNRKFVLDF